MKRSNKIALGAVILTLAAVLWWLFDDEPTLRHSAKFEDYVTSPPEAPDNYQRWFKLSHQIPVSQALQDAINGMDKAERKGESREAILLQHADMIEAELAALARELQQMRAIAAYGPIGSQINHMHHDIASFAGMRTLRRACTLEVELCIAKQEQPCDLDNLLAFYEIAANWFPYARAHVHRMMSLFMIKSIQATLEAQLAHLSAQQLIHTQAVLKNDQNDYGAGVMTAFWLEYCTIAQSLDAVRDNMHPAEALLFLPNATLNRYGDALSEAQELYQAGQYEKVTEPFDALYIYDDRYHPRRLRNLGGQRFLDEYVFASDKLLEYGLECTQRRVELLAAIEKRLAELDTEEANNEPAGATP